MDQKANRESFVILIADDEEMVRKIAMAMLESQGYIVLTAANGQEALEVLQNYPGAVDLALCDIRMPRPSGLELRDAILKDRPGTKVALLSGDTSFAGIPDGVPVLAKPFKVGEFRQRVRDWLESE